MQGDTSAYTKTEECQIFSNFDGKICRRVRFPQNVIDFFFPGAQRYSMRSEMTTILITPRNDTRAVAPAIRGKFSTIHTVGVAKTSSVRQILFMACNVLFTESELKLKTK